LSIGLEIETIFIPSVYGEPQGHRQRTYCREHVNASPKCEIRLPPPVLLLHLLQFLFFLYRNEDCSKYLQKALKNKLLHLSFFWMPADYRPIKFKHYNLNLQLSLCMLMHLFMHLFGYMIIVANNLVFLDNF
jgi:hypothetical protein